MARETIPFLGVRRGSDATGEECVRACACACGGHVERLKGWVSPSALCLIVLPAIALGPPYSAGLVTSRGRTVCPRRTHVPR